MGRVFDLAVADHLSAIVRNGLLPFSRLGVSGVTEKCLHLVVDVAPNFAKNTELVDG